MLFCFTLILSACTQSEEDTQEYSGIIADGNVMGYEYIITKEKNTFSWKVGYKGDITTIQESIDNEVHPCDHHRIQRLLLTLSLLFS